MIYTIIILAIVAYLLGSIPSAVWISKHFYGIDIRDYGSKNAGATNVLRVLGRRAAIPVFAMDFLKGFLAVTLSILVAYLPEFKETGEYGLNGIYILKIGLVIAVVLGHIFPVFAGFRGGKGVATLAGAVMGVDPSSILLCLGVWLLVFIITNYVSVASMAAGCSFPLFILISPKTHGSLPLIIFSFVVAILLIVTHRKNIARLRSGTESKISFFKKPPVKRPPRPDGQQ